MPNDNITRGIIITFDNAWNPQNYSKDELYFVTGEFEGELGYRPLKKCAVASRFDNLIDAKENFKKKVNGSGTDENGVHISQSQGYQPEYPQTYFDPTTQGFSTITGKVFLNLDYTTIGDSNDDVTKCFANRDMIFSELALILSGAKRDNILQYIDSSVPTLLTDSNGNTIKFARTNTYYYYTLALLNGLHTKYNTDIYPTNEIVTEIMKTPPHNFEEVYGTP